MCLAIFKNENVELPSKETLRIGFNNNPHGAGFAFSNFQKVTTFKGFFDFDEFYNALIENVKKEYFCIIHFRYATHGTKDINNCHPFIMHDGYDAMIHNGVVNLGIVSEEHSDTYYLSKEIENGNIINHDMFLNTNNKVAIIAPKTHTIYGKWYKHNDVWYSNGTFKKDLTKYQKENKDYQLCDCCGDVGKDYFSTDVGYHFCYKCLENKEVLIRDCKNCKEPTTNHYCNACNNKGFKTPYFL